jgi:uncharacterized glyoxalase superfamily protein PhnB
MFGFGLTLSARSNMKLNPMNDRELIDYLSSQLTAALIRVQDLEEENKKLDKELEVTKDRLMYAKIMHDDHNY